MSSIKYENMDKNMKWIQNLLFAGIFIQENRLHTVYDRYNEMSCKQWLLMIVSNAFEVPPALSELADAMGCSRQNVKKLALQLEKNGYVRLFKSDKDSRALCVEKTEKGIQFSKECTKLGEQLLQEMFCEFTEDEIKQYYHLSIKMMHGIDHLEEFFVARAKEEKQ